MMEFLPNVLMVAATPVWAMFLTAFMIFVVPFLVGSLLGRTLKLQDLSFKMGVVLCVALLGLTPFVWQYVAGAFEHQDYRAALAQWEAEGEEQGEPRPQPPEPRSWRNAIRLGIDLAGGTNLVFQVQPTAEKEITAEAMDQMVGAVGRRINVSGVEEIVVRRVGADRIEVIIPGADPEAVAQVKEQITRLGSLEFAIVATSRSTEHRDLIARAQENPAARDVIRGGRIVAGWRPIALDERDQPKLDPEQDMPIRPGADGRYEVLLVFEPESRRVTGEHLTRANETTDQNGQPAVGFTFSTRGGHLFYSLTSKYRPMQDGTNYKLAVLLDGEVHTAPNLREPISTQGQITGRFTRPEVQALVNVLNAGALELPIHREPVSEQSISPLLGIDVQEKGLRAIAIAAVVVLVFMLAYYWFAGLVANLALVLNLVLVLGAMAFINATFTLPGLAGIVLVIGMAVDANVLIFERIREERARGSSLRMAIQNGFDKALSAIIDANVTTLITAIILYMIGTDQVRGFAVTLFIGIVMSMFTALYFGRMMFEIWERKRWLRELKMFSVMRLFGRTEGATHFDFISKQKIAAVASVVLILGGIGAVFARGTDNLDIDFTGGTMVTFEFEEPQSIDEIRGILQDPEYFGPAITLEQLQLLREPGADPVTEVPRDRGTGTRFRLRTTETNIEQVRRTAVAALDATGHPLRRVTMEYGEITEVPAGPAENGEPETTLVNDAYRGGQQVELAFSDPLRTATAEDYLTRALDQIQISPDPEGDVPPAPKYSDPRALFTVEGIEETDGAPPREGEAPGYDRMRLMALPALERADLETALAGMRQRMANEPMFDEVNSFDSAVASEMRTAAIMAILISLAAIVGYLWFRFRRVTFGLAAVAAIVHDVLFVLGALALASYVAGTPVGTLFLLEDFRLNLPMIAAFLTIVGYSLNDTIVIFDRIREVRGKNPALTKDMINLSMNQTLARTILTSLTTLLVVGILYVFGGEGIHGFAFALVLGVLVGTYSTMFIACPVLLWLMNRAGAPARVSPIVLALTGPTVHTELSDPFFG